jgi:uncharacterized protein (TIGR03067 family)
MKTRRIVFVLLLTAAAGVGAADDAKEQAIARDRAKIAGTWRVVELVIDGNPTDAAEAQKLRVVNGTDGAWTLYNDGAQVAKGTSTFDPTQAPKTIDFRLTEGEGKGQQFVGIYELGEETRKMCFAPSGSARPKALMSLAGSNHICLTFERVKD